MPFVFPLATQRCMHTGMVQRSVLTITVQVRTGARAAGWQHGNGRPAMGMEPKDDPGMSGCNLLLGQPRMRLLGSQE